MAKLEAANLVDLVKRSMHFDDPPRAPGYVAPADAID